MARQLLSHFPVGPLVLCLFLGLFWANPVVAQKQQCSHDVQKPDGYTIHAIVVKGRSVPPLSKLKAPGDFVPSQKGKGLDDMVTKPFSSNMISEAQTAISNYLSSEETESLAREFGFTDTGEMGAVSSLTVDYCLVVNDLNRTVDITMKPRYIRLDLHRIGSNILPVPRSLLPTFYDNVPRPLLAFNPTFGVNNDRKEGVSPSLSIDTNLLDVGNLIRGKTVSANDIRLDLKASGRKSLTDPFYDSQISLTLARRKTGHFMEEIGLDG